MPEFIINIIYLILGASFTAIGGFWKHRRDKRQLTESLERKFMDQYIEVWADYEIRFNKCFEYITEDDFTAILFNDELNNLVKVAADVDKASLALWAKSSSIRSIQEELKLAPEYINLSKAFLALTTYLGLLKDGFNKNELPSYRNELTLAFMNSKEYFKVHWAIISEHYDSVMYD